MDCYKCEVQLTEENASEEHIILNACGGRLKSKSLLCKKCNSEFGDEFDRELAETTNDLANLLMIKRHNGEPQPIRTIHKPTGEKYNIEYGGSPVQSKTNFEITLDDDGKGRLSINAKNEKEFKKTLSGLKRKYPDLDADKILASAQKETFYLSEPLEINGHIGGEGAFKSITKTAVNYYLYNGGSREYIKDLLPYLEGKIEMAAAWMHYPVVDIYTSPQGEVSHVLKLVGNSEEGILYAYVELFNVHCFIVRLNESYTGADIDFDYIFNVHSYEVKAGQTNLKLTKMELNNLFVNKNSNPFDKVKERYARVIPIAYKIQDHNHINKIISKAVDKAFEAVPSGTVMTDEIMAAMREEVVGGIMSFIAHRRREREIEINSKRT
jgi:hypothetical protein